MNEIKVVKSEHPIWKEKAHELLGHKLVGQWHWIYSVEDKSISMITIYGYPIGGKSMSENWDSFQWEIHGYGMPDVERFNTKDEAEARCWELLLTPRGEEMP